MTPPELARHRAGRRMTAAGWAWMLTALVAVVLLMAGPHDDTIDRPATSPDPMTYKEPTP